MSFFIDEGKHLQPRGLPQHDSLSAYRGNKIKSQKTAQSQPERSIELSLLAKYAVFLRKRAKERSALLWGLFSASGHGND